MKKNSSISIKMMATIMALIILIVVTIVVSTREMYAIMDETNEIVDNNAVSLEQVGDFQHGFEAILHDTYAHILAQDDATSQELESALDEETKEIEAIMQSFSSDLDAGTQEESLYKTFETQYKDFKDIFKHVIELSAANNDTEAESVANNELAKAASSMDETLDSLKKYETGSMNNAVKRSDNVFRRAVVVETVFSVLAVCLGIFAVLYTRIAVVKPITSMNKSLNEIVEGIEAGHGDLTKRLPVKSNDELGKLATGINTFLATLQNVMSIIAKNSTQLDDSVKQVQGNEMQALVIFQLLWRNFQLLCRK